MPEKAVRLFAKVIERQENLEDISIGDLIEVNRNREERVFSVVSKKNGYTDIIAIARGNGKFIAESGYYANTEMLRKGELLQNLFSGVRKGGCIGDTYRKNEARRFKQYDRFLKRYERKPILEKISNYLKRAS